MAKIKEKVERVCSCFCKLMRERYVEKLMKEYASVYGMPEHGQMPKYDEQKLQEFENNLPIFADELCYYVMTKLKTDGKVCISTSTYNSQLEALCSYAFEKDMESIVGNYELLLSIDRDVAKVDLAINRGRFTEKYNALTLDMNQMEFGL